MEVGHNRSKNRSLTQKELETAQEFLAERLDTILSDEDFTSFNALARRIKERADEVDGIKKPAKQSKEETKDNKGIDILKLRISEIGERGNWGEVQLREKVIQRLYKGLMGKKLTPDDIGRLKNIIDGDKDDRLGDQTQLVRTYFNVPTQTDQLLREFFSYNNVPQPILICGFAFGRTLEQGRTYIPVKIAQGYTFHFLVFNPFSNHKNIGAYIDLHAYHYFQGEIDEVIDNCHLTLKYLIQTMYNTKAYYNKVNASNAEKRKTSNQGLKDNSKNGGKGFLGKKFQVAFFEYPLFYHGIFANLPEDIDVNKEVDNKFHFVTPEINECDRSSHPVQFYRESDIIKPVIDHYKESVMKQWRRATKFDKHFKNHYSENKKYNLNAIEEEAKKEIPKVVEACNLNDGESILDYFTWRHETKENETIK